MNTTSTSPSSMTAPVWRQDELLHEEDSSSSPSVDRLWTTACDEDGEEPWLHPDDDETMEIPGAPLGEEHATTAVERGPALPTWSPEMDGLLLDLPGSALSSIV